MNKSTKMWLVIYIVFMLLTTLKTYQTISEVSSLTEYFNLNYYLIGLCIILQGVNVCIIMWFTAVYIQKFNNWFDNHFKTEEIK
jgi:hypothetical protein